MAPQLLKELEEPHLIHPSWENQVTEITPFGAWAYAVCDGMATINHDGR